jgi:hypothetical protein
MDTTAEGKMATGRAENDCTLMVFFEIEQNRIRVKHTVGSFPFRLGIGHLCWLLSR